MTSWSPPEASFFCRCNGAAVGGHSDVFQRLPPLPAKHQRARFSAALTVVVAVAWYLLRETIRNPCPITGCPLTRQRSPPPNGPVSSGSSIGRTRRDSLPKLALGAVDAQLGLRSSTGRFHSVRLVRAALRPLIAEILDVQRRLDRLNTREPGRGQTNDATMFVTCPCRETTQR